MLQTALHRWLRVPYTLHIGTRRRVKKPRATVLFIHGIGSSSAMWNDVIKHTPDDVDILTIDLLGFGKSSRPAWAVYNAKTQARSVIATLLKSPPRGGRVILVGHSLGALVAVEVAKRYPLLVRSLVLCSPPFYQDETGASRLPNRDQLLKNLYVRAQRYPDQIVKISALALKYGLVNKAFDVTSHNIDTYIAALESSIVNQTSLEDAKQLRQPTTIIYGALDPVVIRKNLKEVAQANENIRFKQIIAGHEITAPYAKTVVTAIETTLTDPKKP
jgi:pimeloyl-ACP methyl ester carboxylesterase